MPEVTNAAYPVAGMSTRFLPATKANPKEMLPIADKPLIQYAVEYALKHPELSEDFSAYLKWRFCLGENLAMTSDSGRDTVVSDHML